MIAIIFVNTISIICAYIAQRQSRHIALAFSFIIIATFLSIRYDFGNDYMAYMNIFEDLKCRSIFDTYYEKGWVILNKIFPNFFLLVAFLSVTNCIIYYVFINRYVPKEYWSLAVFLYVFNTNFMLIQSSTMRQTVAILIFIISIKYIIEGKIFPYFFCCCLAFTFHQSAIILFPAYYVRKIRFTHTVRVIILIIFCSLYLLSPFIFPLFSEIVTFLFQGRYEHFLYETKPVSFLNSALYVLLLFTILHYDANMTNPRIKMFNRISILALFFFPISSIIPMAARLGYYFFPATLITYSFLAKKMSFHIRIIFLFLLISVILVRFYTIVTSDVWGEHFATYKTILNII